MSTVKKSSGKNCPNCRRHMDYIPILSSPNAKIIKDKKLVYFCPSCALLWVFFDFDTKMPLGGRVVLKVSNIKRAGFFNDKE